jgi:hypothetical protein
MRPIRVRPPLLAATLLGLALAAAAAAAGAGCFVEGRCLSGDDCVREARCLSGQCVACRSAVECAGLLDRNPHSPTYDQPLELIGFREKVVLVYLANGA